METIEIDFNKVKGTATRLTSTVWSSTWKVTAGTKYIIVQENYSKVETYTLIEHSPDVDIIKAKEIIPDIMSQIRKFIIGNAPKPPKRYR